MKKIRAIIVEDEARNANSLKKLTEKYCPNIEILSIAPSVEAAIETIRTIDPDLVFLDVELPDGSGFRVIESFPQDKFSVIFVTAYEHYAIKAIKASAIDYLLKPVDIDDLMTAVNKVQLYMDSPENIGRKEMLVFNSKQENLLRQKIALPTVEGILFVLQEDIVQCEAEGNYTSFYLTTREKILVSKPLNYFEDVLDNAQFCRSHQSHLVNLSHVKKYVKGRGGYLIMNDGSKIEVSARMKTELLDKLIQ